MPYLSDVNECIARVAANLMAPVRFDGTAKDMNSVMVGMVPYPRINTLYPAHNFLAGKHSLSFDNTEKVKLGLYSGLHYSRFYQTKNWNEF